MNIAIFEDGPLLPTTEGASNRIYNLAKYLALNDVNVIFLKCHRECDVIKKFEVESKKYKIKFFLISPEIFYNNFISFEKILRKEKIDFLQIKDPELILTVGIYLKSKLGTKICYETHDLTHIILQQLNFDNEKVNFAKFKELASDFYSDIHTCVSEKDKNEFIKIGCNPDKLVVIPNGVDTKEIKFFGPNFDNKIVLFLGNMFYEPNRYATKVILDKIIPRVHKLNRNIKFLFVGACPDNIKEKYQKKNIIFSGAVEDLNSYLKKSSLCLSPIFQGSGTRIKILHYFAAGKPVISTKLGAEGLNVRSNENIILEDRIKEYPKLILGLLENEKISKKIGFNERKLVEEYYNWEKIARKLKKVYEKIKEG